MKMYLFCTTRMRSMWSKERKEGSQAYLDDLEWEDNPYPKGSTEYNEWSGGYLFTQEGWEN